MKGELAANCFYDPTEKLHILGVDIDNLYMAEAIDLIARRARFKQRSNFAFVNADCLNHAHENFHYETILSRQDAIFPDGSGIALAARMQGKQILANLNGTDMFPLLCEEAGKRDLSVYLLGGREGIAEAAAERMVERYPDLKIAGVHHGYFSRGEEQSVIRKINASEADILLVGLGAPSQEVWLDEVRDELTVPVCMGVGGLFDYYSGRIPRAPLWLRNIGCEWIWRLAQEPGRLWKRYLIGNPIFVMRAFREALFGPKRLESPISPKKLFLVRAKRGLWQKRQAAVGGIKRAIDVCAASCTMLLLSPLFLLTSLAIRLESEGPIFFAQTRVGMNGNRFKMYKFRSMYIDAEKRRAQLLAQSERPGAHFKMKHDPRITKVGRFIRKFSIDELPQLWNVINGTMSLVGPRPNLETEVEQYKLYELGRLAVKPGITCFWQVSGRADLPWERQVELDLNYVHQRSLKTDLHLMLRTIPAVIGGKGAY
jgi:exopolysaccharide biosynthesis WecB/TagA/CpsF family protein